MIDIWLVYSFVDETRIQGLVGDNEFSEVAGMNGFRRDCSTLIAKNCASGIIQVTPYEVLCLDQKSLQLVSRYAYSSDNVEQISYADVCGDHVLLCVGQSLVLLAVNHGNISEKGRIILDYQISCLSLSADLMAIGLWEENSVQLLNYDFSVLFKTILVDEFTPKSVLLIEMESQPYLLVSLTDGSLCYALVTDNIDLHFKKTVLGSLPITLKPFMSDSKQLIFCSCDKPTLIYSKSGRLLFSSVNLDNVYAMTSFNDHLALITSSGLLLTKLDTIQKIHVKKVDIGLTCRRIVYDSMSYTVVCQEGDSCKLRLYSSSFDILDEYQFGQYELAVSLVTFQLTKSFVAVGTGLALPDEDEPTSGRLLLFSIEGGKLELVCELEIKGCMYSIATIGGSLIAAVNASVSLITDF
jgi:DNA damage-binding protein 1